MSLKALVADDSILFRRVLAEALSSLPGVEVVGAVGNGRLALQKIRELKPDLLTLDMEMPEMDGLAVLDALRQSDAPPAVIVVSALTRKGGQLTMRALERGAFDFITKPDAHDAQASREAILRELTPRVRSLSVRTDVKRILRDNSPSAPSPFRTTAIPSPAAQARAASFVRPTAAPEMVLIGVSTGGPAALGRVLPLLPATLNAPVLVVQHMPPVFTQSLAESLGAKCALRVKEAAQGDILAPNNIYIAPGGKQMRIQSLPGGSKAVQITDDPPENNCRPSVDYLFRSAASNFPGRSMAVIMTGMGNDGTLGLRLLKRHGCFVIAQDEASSVVFGMPKAAIEAGVTDVTIPLDSIAARIVAAVRGGQL
jgi:two-component system chemotaxis response regulator CheB